MSQFNPVVGGVIFNESEISITDAPGLGIIEVRGLEMIVDHAGGNRSLRLPPP